MQVDEKREVDKLGPILCNYKAQHEFTQERQVL